MKNEIEYCYECIDFPCKQLQKLDKKYRERFHMSMIKNLEYIRNKGMNESLKSQEETYKCPKYRGVVCAHNCKCYNCNTQIKE